MPPQTTYFEQQIGEKRIVVVKSYDAAFAQEAFRQVNLDALSFLSRSLNVTDTPLPEDENYADALWDEVQEGAREDWNTFSYFIVRNTLLQRQIAEHTVLNSLIATHAH
jgi:hypothetical protein